MNRDIIIRGQASVYCGLSQYAGGTTDRMRLTTFVIIKNVLGRGLVGLLE